MKSGKLGQNKFQGLQIVAIGALTGAFVGVIVTLYACLVELTEEFARGYYAYFAEHPAFIPLLFLGLLLGAVVIGGTLRALPVLRGSGFPQTEGAAQGLLRFKWYKMLTGAFAASLVCIFFGLSAGAEGPGLLIGGACGDGFSSAFRRNAVMRRYLITGGACAGLAVSLNAPLTGIVFAYEETHKRFTPEVFACSFTSVVIAVLIRSVLAPAVGLFNRPIFVGFDFVPTTVEFIPYVLLAALLVSLAGVGFYFLVLLTRKLFKKIGLKSKLATWIARMTVPFLFAGACGLITVHAMGSGTFFIGALQGGAKGVGSIFSTPLWATLLIAVGLRTVAVILNLGAEVPCCSSLPMFALGAGMGALLSVLFVQMGMDPALSDTLVVICLSTFFVAVVKAPLTGIILSLELTGSFTFLLPVVLSVAVAYFASYLFKTEPIYEKFLEELVEDRQNGEKKVVSVRVGGQAAGRSVRDILWPDAALIVSVVRGEQRVIPSGGLELLEGDILTVEAVPLDEREYLAALRDTVGEVLLEPPAPPAEPPNGQTS